MGFVENYGLIRLCCIFPITVYEPCHYQSESCQFREKVTKGVINCEKYIIYQANKELYIKFNL